jgi:hypothetical protein
MKIAIVHDALCVSGGAERLVLWMSKAFPDAPVYTSVTASKHFTDSGSWTCTLPLAVASGQNVN